MLSNAFKKSFSSVYEPNAYKKLYKLMIGFFSKESQSIHTDFELQLNVVYDKSGLVNEIH